MTCGNAQHFECVGFAGFHCFSQRTGRFCFFQFFQKNSIFIFLPKSPKFFCFPGIWTAFSLSLSFPAHPSKSHPFPAIPNFSTLPHPTTKLVPNSPPLSISTTNQKIPATLLSRKVANSREQEEWPLPLQQQHHHQDQSLPPYQPPNNWFLTLSQSLPIPMRDRNKISPLELHRASNKTITHSQGSLPPQTTPILPKQRKRSKHLTQAT